jgi:hypothetical protein
VAVFAQQVECSTAPFASRRLVVAGHDPVEHRARILAGGGGVVVDHVHAHAQAKVVQRLHHQAELADARGAVIGVHGVAAFGRVEVIGVVAPVEAVARAPSPPRACGPRRRRARRGDRGRDAAALGTLARSNDRQQVHVGQAGLGERAQVAHAGDRCR